MRKAGTGKADLGAAGCLLLEWLGSGPAHACMSGKWGSRLVGLLLMRGGGGVLGASWWEVMVMKG
jgi:hypothetical protein